MNGPLHRDVPDVRALCGFPVKIAVRADPGRPFSAAPLKARLAVLLVLVLPVTPPAWAGGWNGTCENRFRGTSTFHDFAGDVRCQPFTVGVESGADGKTNIREAEIVILVAEMDTDNGSRDRQMREMFRVDRFPRIRGTFRNIDPETFRKELRRGSEAGVPLDFTLTIRDTERTVHAVAGNFRQAGATVSFDVDYSVSLKEYGLVPPKALFGIVKVGDKIAVKTAVRLEAAGAK